METIRILARPKMALALSLPLVLGIVPTRATAAPGEFVSGCEFRDERPLELALPLSLPGGVRASPMAGDDYFRFERRSLLSHPDGTYHERVAPVPWFSDIWRVAWVGLERIAIDHIAGVDPCGRASPQPWFRILSWQFGGSLSRSQIPVEVSGGGWVLHDQNAPPPPGLPSSYYFSYVYSPDPEAKRAHDQEYAEFPNGDRVYVFEVNDVKAQFRYDDPSSSRRYELSYDSTDDDIAVGALFERAGADGHLSIIAANAKALPDGRRNGDITRVFGPAGQGEDFSGDHVIVQLHRVTWGFGSVSIVDCPSCILHRIGIILDTAARSARVTFMGIVMTGSYDPNTGIAQVFSKDGTHRMSFSTASGVGGPPLSSGGWIQGMIVQDLGRWTSIWTFRSL